MGTGFAEALKDWRGQRRISQLDLALSANVSARHISFLETGRARPSRAMVLRLCEQLQVPRADRNHLLTAAGLAPVYGERRLSDDDMAPIRQAVDWMLERHAPYPALALDRHWRLVDLNPPAAQLLAGMGLGKGDSLIDAFVHGDRLRAAIVNLDEVIGHLAVRLRTESAHLGGDAVLDSAIEALGGLGLPGAPVGEGPLPAFIPTRYRFGQAELSLLSTFTQFGSAEDIALAELRIEMMFPADAASRATLLSLVEGAESTA